jgi:DNA-binding CsgD family transcriptional regulator
VTGVLQGAPGKCQTGNTPLEQCNLLVSAKGWVVRESAAGLVLVANDRNPIYVNAEAIQILAYPEAPQAIKFWDGRLAQKIRSMIPTDGKDAHSRFPAEFLSGRRRYLCRVFSLNSNSNNTSDHPDLALILERGKHKSLEASNVAAQFHLTPREMETLRYLMQGLTNKEIGQRMDISENTVKAFLKLIMMKMDVSTRSGIIGKAINWF